MIMNGIIIIDKPEGWTSFDVVAKLRGLIRGCATRDGTGEQKDKIKKNFRVGHGGTLDPMATGVLPVFIGRATRAVEFCENAEKEYIAGLRLGIVTDTQDITGNVLSEKKSSATADDVKAILQRFSGALKQVPPMYSAIKKDGRKLYELARRGIDVAREPRGIYISALELMESGGTDPVFPDFTLRVVCSKGTYIRTLCHDIGEALGCGGTLSALRRIRAGVFTIDMSHTLDDVLATIQTEPDNSLLLQVDSIFRDYPSIYLNGSETRKAKNGASCRVREDTENGKYRVYGPDGEFLLLGEMQYNTIKAIKSFFEIT